MAFASSVCALAIKFSASTVIMRTKAVFSLTRASVSCTSAAAALALMTDTAVKPKINAQRTIPTQLGKFGISMQAAPTTNDSISAE